MGMCWRSRHIWRELPPEATREELLRVVPVSITIKPRLVAVGVAHPKAVSRRVAFNEESSGARSWCPSTIEWECCYNHVPVLLQKRIPMSVTQSANLIPEESCAAVEIGLRHAISRSPQDSGGWLRVGLVEDDAQPGR